MTTNTYVALARRENRWWNVTVDGVGVTQARRLGDAARMAQELIAASIDLSVEDVDVSLRVDAVDGHSIAQAVEAAAAARAAAAEAELRSSQLTRALARELAQYGVPLRDVGEILGISHQRAHQLIGG